MITGEGGSGTGPNADKQKRVPGRPMGRGDLASRLYGTAGGAKKLPGGRPRLQRPLGLTMQARGAKSGEGSTGSPARRPGAGFGTVQKSPQRVLVSSIVPPIEKPLQGTRRAFGADASMTPPSTAGVSTAVGGPRPGAAKREAPVLEEHSRVKKQRLDEQVLFKQLEKDPKSPFHFIENAGRPDAPKFVYMIPVESDSAISPNTYNLEVVEHDKVDPKDYFTLSQDGVTHFASGQADFTPLEQWKREYVLFNRMVQIRLFRQYRMWKSFSTWRKNVRRDKMNRAKKVLSASLFVLNPTMREAIFLVKDKCANIKDMRLHTIKETHTYPLGEFTETQADQRDNVADVLVDLFNEIKTTVAEACRNVLAAAGFSPDVNLNTNEELQELMDRIADETNTAARDDQGMASMNRPGSRGEKKKMTYTEMATKRSECRRLTNFILLCDYLLVDSLYALTIGSIADLVKHLANASGQRPKPEGEVKEKKKAAPAPAPAQSKKPASGALTSARSQREMAKKALAAANPEPEEEEEEEERSPYEELPFEERFDADDDSDEEGESRRKQAQEEMRLIKKNADREAVFQAEFVFNDELRLILTPSGEDFQTQLDLAIEDFVNVVSSVERLVSHDDFTPYTQLSVNDRIEAQDTIDGPDLTSMFVVNPEYQELTTQLRNTLTFGFRRVERFLAV